MTRMPEKLIKIYLKRIRHAPCPFIVRKKRKKEKEILKQNDYDKGLNKANIEVPASHVVATFSKFNQMVTLDALPPKTP